MYYRNMDIFSSDSDTEDTLNIASREWNRIIVAAKKGGFREGIEHGADSVFQEGFDQGYQEGFHTAFLLGKFKSLLNMMPHDTKHPQNINEILEKTRRGACHKCITKEGDGDNKQKSFSDIVKEQEIHSEKILQTLYQYFHLHLNAINVNESNIMKTHNQSLEDD